MVTDLSIAPHTSLPKPRMGQPWGVSRPGISLVKTTARISEVFRVFDGSILLQALFMEFTTAASNHTCDLSCVFDSDAGGDRVIASLVTVQNSAVGDFVYAELDGTALVKAATGTGLIYGVFNRGVGTATDTAASVFGYGIPLTAGGIDLVLGSNALTTGIITMTCIYTPLIEGASLVAEDMVLS